MAEAIEIKYDQDNVKLIQEAILQGLPWNGLDEEKVMEFFRSLKIYTKRSDYRYIEHQFKIMGSYYPKPEPGTGIPEQYRVYDIAFRRSKVKDSTIPEDCVLFETYIHEQDNVKLTDVKEVIDHVMREGSGFCSAAVVGAFNLTFRAKQQTDSDTVLYRDHNFRFGVHNCSSYYVWPDNVVQS